MFKLKQEEKNVAAEITGSEAALKSLRATINKWVEEHKNALLFRKAKSRYILGWTKRLSSNRLFYMLKSFKFNN